jgi:PAS domain S-box-containing protein
VPDEHEPSRHPPQGVPEHLRLAEPRGGLLSAALATIANAVVITDRDGTVEWVNPAFTRMSGYPPEEAVGANPRLWRSGLQDREFYAEMWATILAGRTWRGEVVNRRKSGEHYAVRQTITPIVSPSGDVAHFVAIHEDVTELQRAEIARDLQAQQLAATSAAVAAIDRDGTVAAWNPGARRLLGWSEDEAIGSGVLDLGIVPRHVATPQQALRHLRTASRATGEAMLARRDGTHVPVLLTTAPYVGRDGSTAGVIAIATDITDLHEARGQAEVRNAQQVAVGRLARVALGELDLDVVFEHALRTLTEHLDAPLAKILRLDDGALLLRAGIGWRDGLVDHARVAAGPGSQAGFTLAHGAPVVLEDASTEGRFTVSDLLLDHGAVSGVSTTIRGRAGDYGVLTVHAREPRRFSEDDVAFVDAIAALLGSSIARTELEQQLRTSAADLARAEAIRSAFLRATSHELRTPLTVVAGIADTLAAHGDALPPAQYAELLERQRANAARLSALIEDLLDVDRLESGLVRASVEPHDLRQILEPIAAELDVGDRGLVLDLEPIVVSVDRAKYERIVANLLANAVRHTPEDSSIRVELRRHDDSAVLAVEDDGPGIPEESLPTLFEPFVQGPDSANHPQPGTGIGLTLVREFAALHGGSARAANRPAGGARFEVVLPCEPPVT